MGQFIGLVFGLWARWRPNGWEVTTPPRKFTIISTECTRMRARGVGEGRDVGSRVGDRETVSRRFQIILAFSLRFLLFLSLPSPPSGAKTTFSPPLLNSVTYSPNFSLTFFFFFFFFFDPALNHIPKEKTPYY